MSGLPWTENDGGRDDAGFTGRAGDCVTRAIAIALDLPYMEVYDDLFALQRDWVGRSRAKKAAGANPSPRSGVFREVYEPYLRRHGWTWVPKMEVGKGTTNHLTPGEVPMEGRAIVRLSRHLSAVIDGVVHDTHDPSRGGSRCVYGWYTPEEMNT